MRSRFWLAAVIVCAFAADAAAQATQRPSRPYRGLFGGGPPPDPNRMRAELTMTGSLLVGYDDWLQPGGGSGPLDPTQAQQSGTSVSGDLGMNYRLGNANRTLTVDGRGFTNGYSGIGAGPTIGGDAQVGLNVGLGRVSRLQASQSIVYSPTLVLGAFDALAADVNPQTLPDTAVSSGFTEQRSVSSTSMVNLDRRWNTKHSTAFGAGLSQSRFLDNVGHDAHGVMANASHSWTLGRRASVSGVYGISDTQLDGQDGVPNTNHNLEGVYAYTRRLSPSRTFSMSVGMGSTYVSTLTEAGGATLAYWMPSGHGSASVDIGRSWSVSGDYRRAANVLQGISVTSFATDNGSVQASGLFGRRIEAALSATYSNGRAGGGESQSRFEMYSGSMQLRYAVGRRWAATLAYDYYVYQFSDVSDFPAGFPASYDRQAIRVGISLWLPLYGTYLDGAGSRGGRQ